MYKNPIARQSILLYTTPKIYIEEDSHATTYLFFSYSLVHTVFKRV